MNCSKDHDCLDNDFVSNLEILREATIKNVEIALSLGLSGNVDEIEAELTQIYDDCNSNSSSARIFRLAMRGLIAEVLLRAYNYKVEEIITSQREQKHVH